MITLPNQCLTVLWETPGFLVEDSTLVKYQLQSYAARMAARGLTSHNDTCALKKNSFYHICDKSSPPVQSQSVANFYTYNIHFEQSIYYRTIGSD